MIVFVCVPEPPPAEAPKQVSANSSFEQQLEDSLHSGTEAGLLPPFLLGHPSCILGARLRSVPAQIKGLLSKDQSSVPQPSLPLTRGMSLGKVHTARYRWRT